jgi:hypothetical protein
MGNWGTIPDLVPTCFLLGSNPVPSPHWGVLSFAHWWAGTSYKVVVPARQAGNRFLGSEKSLQILALYFSYSLFTLYNTHVHLQYTIHSIMIEKRKTEEQRKPVV